MTTSPAPLSILGRALEYLHDSVPTTLALLSDRPLSTQQLTGIVAALDAPPEAPDGDGPMTVTFITRRGTGSGALPRTFSSDDVAWLRPATPSEVLYCAPEIDTAVVLPAPAAPSPAP